jgi:transposase
MLKGGLILSKNEQFKLMVIQEYREGIRSRKEAAQLLGVSTRTITRWSESLREKGPAGVKHGNAGRRPAIAKEEELKNTVLSLAKERYYDFNIAHTRDMLKRDYGIEIAYSTLHSWCQRNGIQGKRKRRPSKTRMYRERLSNAGLLIQLDGSSDKWNGKDEWVLIAGIDDATSEIPFAEFFPVENTWNCMKILREIIVRKGIPVAIYTDQAGWLAGNKRQNFSQFVRACEELGINVIAAKSPQAKGRIERAWDTFQDRLIPELRLAGITEMQKANRYLQDVFIEQYWKDCNTVLPKNEISRFRKLSDWINLDEVLCWKYDRYIRNDSTFSFQNKLWKITGGVIGTLRQRQVKIHLYEDQSFSAFFGQYKLEYVEIISPKRRWKSVS